MTLDALAQLRDALVSAFPDPPEARELAARAGFAEGSLPIDQHDMRGWWWASLHEAWRQGILVAVVDAAIADVVIGPTLKQPFVELREPISQLQKRPAPRPRGVRIALTAAAGLLVVATLALGRLWLMAPVKMDDTRRYEIALAGFGALTANGVQASSQAGSRDPGQYKIAVAQLGHLSDEGTVEISEFERNASRIINAQFDAAPLRNEKLVPPVIWHDSMAWTEKGIRLGVVTGLTERDQQAAAKALADRVGADLLIWGGEVITETDRGLAFRFYSRELYEGEEMIDESQLGAPASSIDDINSYARALSLFAWALYHDADGSYDRALDEFERAKTELDNTKQKPGLEVLDFFIGREHYRIAQKDCAPESLEKAIENFEAAIKKNDSYARPHLGLAGVYIERAQAAEETQDKLNELDRALDEYEKASEDLDRSPDSRIHIKTLLSQATTYTLRAVAQRDQGDYEQAFGSLDHADEMSSQALELLEAIAEQDDQAQYLTALAWFDLAGASHARARFWCDCEDQSMAADHYDVALEEYGLCITTARAVPARVPDFIEDLKKDCEKRSACTHDCLKALQGGQDGCSTTACEDDCTEENCAGY